MDKATHTIDDLKFFIEDSNFYTLWKYGTPRLTDDDYYRFEKISPLDIYSRDRVFKFIQARLELAGVKFSGIGLYSDSKDELNTPKKISANVSKSLKKLLNGDGSPSDVENIEEKVESLYHNMYFQPELSDEELAKLKKHTDNYISDFLNQELFVYDRNYLTFEEQKQFFLKKMEKMNALAKFGENFIICDTQTDNGFLFIHTLYAMQKLNYLGVLRLWHTVDNSLSYKPVTFFANVVIFDPLIEEINRKFKEDNPSLVYEGYEDGEKAIKFAGKKIEFSKGGRETDPVLLVKTLAKEPNRYWFEDEILEDWGYPEKDDAKKNKVYFAAKKVNQVIKEAIKIDDFLDHSTVKFRINPKYLKVDK